MLPFLKYLKTMPEKPGVYLIIDKEDKPIFISRATNLKEKLRYHLTHKDTKRNSIIINNTSKIQYEVIEDNLQATRRELELIQQHYPPLNGTKKGVKQYRFIKVFATEQFPRVRKKKTIEEGDDKLLGPFPKTHHIQKVLKLAANHYKIADCGKEVVLGDDHSIVRTCIRRQTQQCMRPCEVQVDPTRYQKAVDGFVAFFNDEDHSLQAELQSKMRKAVDDENFELASKLRDDLAAIRRVGLES